MTSSSGNHGLACSDAMKRYFDQLKRCSHKTKTHQVRLEGEHHSAEQCEHREEEEAGAGRGKLDPPWHRLCSDGDAWKVVFKNISND